MEVNNILPTAIKATFTFTYNKLGISLVISLETKTPANTKCGYNLSELLQLITVHAYLHRE